MALVSRGRVTMEFALPQLVVRLTFGIEVLVCQTATRAQQENPSKQTFKPHGHDGLALEQIVFTCWVAS